MFLIIAAVQGVQSIEIKCRYYDYDWNSWGGRYTCAAKLDDVLEANVNVNALSGSHVDGKTDRDVLGVEIHTQKTNYLVQGLTAAFPKMDELYVFRSDLKYLTKQDLFHYRFLRTISLSRNKLSSIPTDAFDDLVNVEYFSLSFNYLTEVPNIKHLASLKELYLFENSIESLTAADLSCNSKLEVLWMYNNKLRFIDPNVFDALPLLSSADLKDNRCISTNYKKTCVEAFKQAVIADCSKAV